MSDKCPYCESPFDNSDFDDNGNPVCGCDGETAERLRAENTRLKAELAGYKEKTWVEKVSYTGDIEPGLYLAVCHQCRGILSPRYTWKYCPNCGRKIDWDHKEGGQE